MVAHLPGRVMIDVHLRRQRHRLGEVNQPHARVRLIVHEEQRAADHLVRLEELRDGQSGAYSTQALYVTGLRNKRKESVKQEEGRQQMLCRITHQNVWMAAEKLGERQLDLIARLGRLEIFGTGAVALLDALQAVRCA